MASVLYSRGAAVKGEKGSHLTAEATYFGARLGSKFVKVNCPKRRSKICKDIKSGCQSGRNK